MTTRAGYSTLSGSNNIRMRGRYVTVDRIPPQFATIKNKHGYFTSNGPSNVLYVKSYLQFGAAGVSTRSTLDLTLKGGYKKVTTTYKWSQG